MWLKSWMKIVESKDVLRIQKVFIEELSSAQNNTDCLTFEVFC